MSSVVVGIPLKKMNELRHCLHFLLWKTFVFAKCPDRGSQRIRDIIYYLSLIVLRHIRFVSIAPPLSAISVVPAPGWVSDTNTIFLMPGTYDATRSPFEPAWQPASTLLISDRQRQSVDCTIGIGCRLDRCQSLPKCTS